MRGKYQQHGMSRTDMYRIWRNIKDRCANPNNPYFHNYGGRGILLADCWIEDFAAFNAHMGERPSRNHTVARIKNDNGYEPGNVRWATRKEQARNMRKNVFLTCNGECKTIAEWAETVGMRPSAIWYRVFTAGMSHAEAVMTPRRGGRPPRVA